MTPRAHYHGVCLTPLRCVSRVSSSLLTHCFSLVRPLRVSEEGRSWASPFEAFPVRDSRTTSRWSSARLSLRNRTACRRSSRCARSTRLPGLSPPQQFVTSDSAISRLAGRCFPGIQPPEVSIRQAMEPASRSLLPCASSPPGQMPPGIPALRSFAPPTGSTSPQDGVANLSGLSAPCLVSGRFSLTSSGLIVSPPAQGASPPLARRLWMPLSLSVPERTDAAG